MRLRNEAALTVGNRTIAGPGTTIAGRNEDASGFFARGRIAVDTRTRTAYGTLRAYVRYQIDRLQGVYSGGGFARNADAFANQGGNNAYLDEGSITFAVITAGRVQSFFDFYADTYNCEGIANSDVDPTVFAGARYGGETIPDLGGFQHIDHDAIALPGNTVATTTCNSARPSR